jgi:hypothetical protein
MCIVDGKGHFKILIRAIKISQIKTRRKLAMQLSMSYLEIWHNSNESIRRKLPAKAEPAFYVWLKVEYNLDLSAHQTKKPL